MTGPSIDLDALREKAEAADGYHVLIHPRDVFAVLALVDELRKALTRLRDYGALTDEFVRMTAEAALAGSPAEKEQTDA